MFNSKPKKEVLKSQDLGEIIEAIEFKLICSSDLKRPDGTMDVSAIILHGKALYDAKKVLGSGYFLLTEKGFLTPECSPTLNASIVQIDICESSNLSGFSNLRSAMSKNAPLTERMEATSPHFHHRGVRRIGWNPEAKHFFIF